MLVAARAVVIGAGIGGLAAAVGLQQAGWEVTVCERAGALEPVGAGLAVAPNGLRALDVLGAGDEIRRLAIAQEPGIRRRDGRWLARSSATISCAALRAWSSLSWGKLMAPTRAWPPPP